MEAVAVVVSGTWVPWVRLAWSARWREIVGTAATEAITEGIVVVVVATTGDMVSRRAVFVFSCGGV